MAASFSFLLSLIISLIIFPFLSSSTRLNSLQASSTIPTSLTNSPFQELSPEIAPLLPSPGGVLPSPAISSLPTIPSTPSPPNPDALPAPGPGSALSPLASLPASSAAPHSLVNLAIALFCKVYWSLQLHENAFFLFYLTRFKLGVVYIVSFYYLFNLLEDKASDWFLAVMLVC
ncbi:hypothetical protein JCGZ_02029 [Jatropha curcas]|uniref:Uncharacterized protein n=1 Tax=Jatropha curcas TaxID=180498 RepID=A0A067KUY4_JATCU|nr:hypothetical protein JCGZ_02029 [Jatropha curcas]